MSRALPKYHKRRIAMIGGASAVVLSGALIAGSALAGETSKNNAAQASTKAAAGTISCPAVAPSLPAVPASAKAEVDRNLALLNTQIAEANKRLRETVGQGGPNFVQNAILGPLKDKRVATINRIATAIGRTAARPQGLDSLAPCTLGAGGATNNAGGNAAPPAAPAAGQANGGNTGGNTGAGTISCPDVASRLPAVPASAKAEVDRNLALLNMSDVRNVIIIGSGPAGYTAALYTARASLKPLVFEGAVTAGGALMNTTDVENFPGFQDGIMGPELMDNMRAQAERFGAELVPDDVVNIDLTGEIKTVTDTAGTVHRAKAVIVATGSQHRKLGLPNEDALSGRGVSWCATCDGFFFKDQDIAVIGGGDTAMEEATFLSRFARSVTVVHRRDTLRASKAMQERAFADPKITFVWDSEVAEIQGDGKLSGLKLRNVKTGELSDLAVTGLFIAIGHDPRTELFKGRLELDEEGYLMVDAPSTRTNVTGVFGAGDVVDHTYRQAITAAGTGCAAALDAERFLAALADTEQTAEPDKSAVEG